MKEAGFLYPMALLQGRGFVILAREQEDRRSEILCLEEKAMKQRVDRIVKLGLLAALSILLVMVIHFPIFPAVSFLEYDMADVPILIGGFLYGPGWGLLLTLAVSVLQGITVSSGSGWIGIVMHFVATGAFVLVAGSIYQKKHDHKGALLALAAGSLTMIAVMIPLNMLLTPLFMVGPEFPYAAAQQMVISQFMGYIIAFNAIKTIVNALITLLLYKSISKILKKEFVH